LGAGRVADRRYAARLGPRLRAITHPWAPTAS
jgi:hypothetical protein